MISIYKVIIRKMNLSKKQLLLLKRKLTKTKICAGDFVQGKKMCPSTIALSIKSKRHFKTNGNVMKNLKKLGITRLHLYLFYITFDIPAMISKRLFEKRLKGLRKVIDELVDE